MKSKLLGGLFFLALAGMATWGIVLLFPFSRTWNNAIGIGILTNVIFAVNAYLLSRENAKLYSMAVESTEKLIEVTEDCSEALNLALQMLGETEKSAKKKKK